MPDSAVSIKMFFIGQTPVILYTYGSGPAGSCLPAACEAGITGMEALRLKTGLRKKANESGKLFAAGRTFLRD